MPKVFSCESLNLKFTDETLTPATNVIVNRRIKVTTDLQAVFSSAIIVGLIPGPVLGLDGVSVEVVPHALVVLVGAADPHSGAFCELLFIII